MRTLNLIILSVVSCLYVSTVLAADALVTIITPVGGTKFNPTDRIEVAYKATAGLEGDHIHLFVDDKKPVILLQLNGRHTLDPLAAGKHGICVRLVNKEHAETGTQDCVMFRVE